MKAIRMHAFGGPEVLHLDEVDTPTPGPGEVLVKVDAAGVAYGDIMKRQGSFGQDLPLPAALGLQVGGVVTELGPETDGPEPGTPVIAWVDSGYAQYAVAQQTAVVPLPDGIDVRLAATLPVQGLTAYQTVADAGALQPGESVLVHAAAGGVGSLTVQLAVLMGADIIIGTASSPEKLDRIHALGATAAVDYTRDDWPQRVLEATEGRGVDLVLDSVGGGIGSRSVQCLAPFGRMVSYGAASGSPAEVTTISLMHNNLSVTGYSLDAWLDCTDRTAAALENLVEFIASGQITASDPWAIPLEEAAQAHGAIGERRTLGATVLLP